MAIRIIALLMALTCAGTLAYAAVADASAAKPLRATRAEVAAFCQAEDALPWGTEATVAARRGQDTYGCITPRGWIRCDRHGNCAGGDGAANRLNGGRGLRSSPQG